MAVDPKRLNKDIRRCEEAIHSAWTLFEEKLYHESISRAYYSIIHGVMLYLCDAGFDTRIPEKAEKIFTPSFVAEHDLEEKLYTIFESVRKAKRESAHNFLIRYSGEETREAISEARVFLDMTKKHFRLHG